MLVGIGEGRRKSVFRLTKAVISLKRGKIGAGLLLKTDRKSPTRFRLVPKSTTVHDLKVIIVPSMRHNSSRPYNIRYVITRIYRARHKKVTP